MSHISRRLAREKRSKTGLYITCHPMMGYDKNYIHFIFSGARGRGKSVLALDAPISACEKYGYENVKVYYFRLSDTSVKSMLANNADKSVDPWLIDKYKMKITRKGNIVYNHGKKLMEIYSLVSAPKNKGSALYDYNFLNNRPIDPKTGKPIKRFIYLILDEFQIAEGLERNSVANKSTAALFKIYTETILRDQEFLDYPAVKCIYLANNVAECSSFTTEMWGYYMPPGKFGITKCKRKNAVFISVENSEEYVEKRKSAITGSITDFENDSNYSNQIIMDLSMIKPRKTKIYKVTQLIKFSKNPGDWFCVYDGKYIKHYHNQTVRDELVVPMTRHLDNTFNKARQDNVFEMYDNQSFMYCDVATLANFRARMKELKIR
jgi:hypothetical protein